MKFCVGADPGPPDVLLGAPVAELDPELVDVDVAVAAGPGKPPPPPGRDAALRANPVDMLA